MSITIPFEIEAEMPYNVSPDDNFGEELDLSSWLDDDTILSVTYSAKDEDGVSVSIGTLIDTSLSTFTSQTVKPYIASGGVVGKSYRVKMLVATNGGDEKAFYLRWVCSD